MWKREKREEAYETSIHSKNKAQFRRLIDTSAYKQRTEKKTCIHYQENTCQPASRTTTISFCFLWASFCQLFTEYLCAHRGKEQSYLDCQAHTYFQPSRRYQQDAIRHLSPRSKEKEATHLIKEPPRPRCVCPMLAAGSLPAPFRLSFRSLWRDKKPITDASYHNLYNSSCQNFGRQQCRQRSGKAHRSRNTAFSTTGIKEGHEADNWLCLGLHSRLNFNFLCPVFW